MGNIFTSKPRLSYPGLSINQYRTRIEDKLIQLGCEDAPLNILVIGEIGAGKSSFINSLVYTLCQGDWAHVTKEGSNTAGNRSKFSITQSRYHIRLQIPNQRGTPWILHQRRNGIFRQNQGPYHVCLIDVPGEWWESVGHGDYQLKVNETLGLFTDGKLTEDQSIPALLKEKLPYIQNLGLSEVDEKLKIDRMIVISAASRPIPDMVGEIVTVCKSGARSKGLGYSGVLTKKDTMRNDESTLESRRKDMMQELRSESPEDVLVCQNYAALTEKRQDEEMNRCFLDYFLWVVNNDHSG